MEIIISVLVLVGLIWFFAPTSKSTIIGKLEAEGYRHIVIMKKLNMWEYEVNVNHINLKVRTKIKVFSCTGYISAEIIDYV